ncbi:unnamed protein product [Paramecium sonneborni]|uniref:VWFA domain-containing protein n=1 Tax=Paramecium sonneborni TaxID=65129 RepID=A0A8S1MPT6_9CILI|nr:unnamed protein product [Paramecium sonneborni]
MGNQCTGVDDFQGQQFAPNISVQDEVFVEGRVPIVGQNPSRFNDDDMITVYQGNNNRLKYGRNSLGQGYMQAQKYNLQDNISIKASSQGLRNQGNVALMITIQSNDILLINQRGQECVRQGIDLVCLIDHSGSMQGEKIKLVRKTLKQMLTFLQPVDRLCLIMFDCRCYRLTRLMRVTQENVRKFRVAISSLQARGGTDIGNGMKMALSILKHRKYKNPISAIFLLSDGVDEGAEERVRDDLIQYNIRDSFTIKTFGFGRDCCPKIMSEIAHYKEGQFYFVPNLTNIDECFAEALGGLVSVVANHVQLSVQPMNTNKIQIKKAYGDKWNYDSWKGAFTLYQPHLLSGVRKDYIFEISDYKNNVKQEVRVLLQADPVEGGDKVTIEQILQINNSDLSNEVLPNYYRVKGAECFEQARIQAEQGQYQTSQQILQNINKEIKLQNFNDPNLQVVQTDLEMASNFCYPGQFENEGRHHMHQLHIVHMYQKSRGVQINQNQDGQLITLDCQYQNNLQKQFKDQTIQIKQNDPNYWNDC